jgi:hypothetical protein
MVVAMKGELPTPDRDVAGADHGVIPKGEQIRFEYYVGLDVHNKQAAS